MSHNLRVIEMGKEDCMNGVKADGIAIGSTIGIAIGLVAGILSSEMALWIVLLGTIGAGIGLFASMVLQKKVCSI